VSLGKSYEQNGGKPIFAEVLLMVLPFARPIMKAVCHVMKGVIILLALRIVLAPRYIDL
jgi:hypothetical protein